MSYELRSARLSDLDDLTSLSEISFSAGLAGPYEPCLIEKALPYISHVSKPLVESGQLYVAEAGDGSLVGAGGWSREYHGMPAVDGVAHIRQFVVHPDSMKQGIGRALFHQCLDAARGISQFDCQASLSAVAFYQSLGFCFISGDEVILPNGVVFPTSLMRYKR